MGSLSRFAAVLLLGGLGLLASKYTRSVKFALAVNAVPTISARKFTPSVSRIGSTSNGTIARGSGMPLVVAALVPP